MSVMRTSFAGAAVVVAVALSACGGSGGAARPLRAHNLPPPPGAPPTAPAPRPRAPRRPRRRARGRRPPPPRLGPPRPTAAAPASGGPARTSAGRRGWRSPTWVAREPPATASWASRSRTRARRGLPHRRLSRDPVPRPGRLGAADDPAAHHRRLLRPPHAGAAHAPARADRLVPARRLARRRLERAVQHRCRPAGDRPQRHRDAKVQIPNGASECGTTTVSPLQPGTSAYP